MKLNNKHQETIESIKKLLDALKKQGSDKTPMRFDSGGSVPAFTTQAPTSTGPTQFQSNMPSAGTVAGNWGSLNFPNLINNAGGATQSIASDFTAQNQFQANLPGIQIQNLAPQIGQLQNQNSTVYGQEQGLAGQLYNQANGLGPNVAQNQLNQTTGQNVADQAALMAGQRGSSSNVGLIARQAAQQGAATQQQATGQAATLRSQQQLAAQQNLSSLLNNTANQSLQGQSIAQGAQASQNTAINQGSLGVQGINANTAQSNANAVNTTTGGLLSGGTSVLSSLADGGLIGDQSYSNPSISLPSETPSDVGVSMPGDSSSSGGKSDSGGGAAGLMGLLALMAKGGDTSNLTNAPQSFDTTNSSYGPQSQFGQFLLATGPQGTGSYAKGGRVNALVSPGEKFLKPKDVEKVKRGANPMKVGETIPGHPLVGGAKNSYYNDIVPKKLDVGGIVIPRSATKSKNPERTSTEFVSKVLSKRKK